MKESTLQTKCFKYLSEIKDKPDLFFFSIPNEHYGISHAQRTTLKKMGLVSGVPDFQILFKGEMFFIEFKKLGGKPREEQKRIHCKILKSEFQVFVIDSFEEFESLIKQKGII